MKTIKEIFAESITEGFFNTSGSGKDAAIKDILTHYIRNIDEFEWEKWDNKLLSKRKPNKKMDPDIISKQSGYYRIKFTTETPNASKIGFEYFDKDLQKQRYPNKETYYYNLVDHDPEYNPFKEIPVRGIQLIEIPEDYMREDMSMTFSTCSIRTVYIHGWGKCKNASAMFRYCEQLRNLYLPDDWGNVEVLDEFITYSFGYGNMNTINLPKTWGKVRSIEDAFKPQATMNYLILPDDWSNIKNNKECVSVYGGVFIKIPNKKPNISEPIFMISSSPSLYFFLEIGGDIYKVYRK